MNSGQALCPDCKTALNGALCNTSELVQCSDCDSWIQVQVFPALFKPLQTGRSAESVLEAGVSSCFYHDQKKAVVPCDGCGRFLCALCDVDLNGQHLCPVCLQTGKTKGKLNALETSRTLYDSAALSLSILPILFWPATLVTAPAAIVCAVFSWLKPGSLVPRTRLRSYLAIFFALIQIAAWIYFLFIAGKSSGVFGGSPNHR